jgi:ribosome-associated toxin RatA of RatAB toxin-antitoxin module
MFEPIQRNIKVDAKPERVLEILKDFEAYPTWQDGIESAEIIARDEQGRPSQVKLLMSAMGIKSGLEIAVRYPEEGIAWSLTTGDLMTQNETTYALKEDASAGTDVELSMLAEMKLKVPEFMLKQFLSKGANDSLQGIKRRAEGV